MYEISPPLSRWETGAENESWQNDQEAFRLPKDRLDWSPTPLDPYDVASAEGVPYMIASLDKIEAKMEAIEGDYPPELLNMVSESLMAVTTARCDKNYSALHRHQSHFRNYEFSDEFVEAHTKARQGVADTAESLQLVAEPNGLRSIEIGKETHPLDWDATDPVEQKLQEEISLFDENAEFTAPGYEPRYKFYRANNQQNPQFITLSRKRNFAYLPEDDLEIIKRSQLVVRLDEEGLTPEQQIPSEVKQRIKQGLAKKEDINEVISELGPNIEQAIYDHSEWIAPTGTLYYCKKANGQELEYRRPDLEALNGHLGSAAVDYSPDNPDE